MVEKSELLRVPAFADLPDDQIAWFIGQSEELHLKGGEAYIREGDPADTMFVVLEGQLQARGELGGETIVVSIKPGATVFTRIPFGPTSFERPLL